MLISKAFRRAEGFFLLCRGRGAVVCAGESITCAWKQGQSDGSDFVDCAVKAAERMKKNLTRYVTVL